MPPMTKKQADSGIRRGVERRLEFIEYRVFWEGAVNRADIMEKFGVSLPQASNDLTQYQALAPTNIRYSASEKRYVPTAEFKPIFHTPNASHYLVELKSFADEVLSVEQTWAAEPPTLGVLPIPGRRVDATVLRSLLRAVRAGQAVHVHYHSISGNDPEATWRWISPHAFGFDGLRWHVRALCHTDERFRDFVLSRFDGIGEVGLAKASAELDGDWNSFFDVTFLPNPSLGSERMRTVELDYEMIGGRLTLSVRRALLYYLEKHLRLDVPEAIGKPYESPIVVCNGEEFRAAIRNANGAVLGKTLTTPKKNS